MKRNQKVLKMIKRKLNRQLILPQNLISTRKLMAVVYLLYKISMHISLCNRYKTATGSSQYRFGVLLKIVKHMKTRHQDGDTHPLTIEDILDETNQLDVGVKVKQVNLQFSLVLHNSIF